MSEILSEEQLASMRLYPERSHVRDLVDSHRALQAQLAELNESCTELRHTNNMLMEQMGERDTMLTAAQQRVKELEDVNARLVFESNADLVSTENQLGELQAKVTALEQQLSHVPYAATYSRVYDEMKAKVTALEAKLHVYESVYGGEPI